MPQNQQSIPPAFGGFLRKPDGNFAFTMVPNQFLDEIVPYERPCVVKVICLILRRTIGWLDENGHRRSQEQVAYSEFVREMHMSTQAVADGIRIALEKGYIIRVKPGSSSYRTTAPEGAWYSLRWQEVPHTETHPVSASREEITLEVVPADSDKKSQVTLNSRDMRNKAESGKKEIKLELNSTHTPEKLKAARQAKHDSEKPAEPKFSIYIGNVISEIGEVFGDTEHRLPNIQHALNLWDKPAMPEADFVKLLYQARDLTRQNTSANQRTKPASDGSSGQKGLRNPAAVPAPQRNRMAYFFRVLEKLVKKPLPVSVADSPSVKAPRLDLRQALPPTRQLTEISPLPRPVDSPPLLDGFVLPVLRQDLAERWSVDPAKVLAKWEALLLHVEDPSLQKWLAKSLGLEGRLARPEILMPLELDYSNFNHDQIDIILLSDNPFLARYLQQHLAELNYYTKLQWQKPVVFHFLYI